MAEGGGLLRLPGRFCGDQAAQLNGAGQRVGSHPSVLVPARCAAASAKTALSMTAPNAPASRSSRRSDNSPDRTPEGIRVPVVIRPLPWSKGSPLVVLHSRFDTVRAVTPWRTVSASRGELTTGRSSSSQRRPQLSRLKACHVVVLIGSEAEHAEPQGTFPDSSSSPWLIYRRGRDERPGAGLKMRRTGTRDASSAGGSSARRKTWFDSDPQARTAARCC